jgi:tetratricopeptide (TPR) repeat protein
MSKSLRFLLIFATGSALLFGGCSRQAKEARAIARANRYFDAGQYDAAQIEYFTALRLNGRNAEAIAHLGIIYFDQGRVGESYAFLVAGRQMQPDNYDLRLKYGLFLLAYGKFTEARAEAVYILDHDPAHKEAPLLLVQSSTEVKDIAAARQKLAQLPAPAPTSAPVLVALGMLDFRQHHFPEAEAQYRRALAVDPKYSAAYTALGALYWEKKDLPNAEIAFGQAANFSAQRSQKRLQFAQFKIQTGKRDEGRQILEDIIRKTPDFLPAAMLLAQLDEDEKKYDEGQTAVANVLSRDPGYPDALLLSGRLLLDKGDGKGAVVVLERALHFYPNYPQISYQLAMAYLAAGQAEKATNSLIFAISKAPDYAEAVIALAKLDLQKGDLAAASVALRQLIQKRPDSVEAHVILANAYIAQNDADDALEVFRQLALALPNNPEPLFLAGTVFLREGKVVPARGALEASLKLSPDYLPSLERLVDLDLYEKKFTEARQMIAGRIAANPKLPDLYVFLGRILVVSGDNDPSMKATDYAQGEANLRKAIELAPQSPNAYYLLAELYVTNHQEKKALADLQEEVAKNPKATPAWILTGTIQYDQKAFPEARVAYEKVLAIDPNSSVALNNLAYLYSENFGEVDKALDMAQRARKLLPNDARVADTLGWILFKKHQYEWALSLLQEGATNLPDEPEGQYHLGMAQYMMGQVGPAQISFGRAVALKQDFGDLADAQQRLAVLAIDVQHATPAEVTVLEKAAIARPGDPVILPRLAAVYERAGQPDKAIKVCEQALAANPDDVAALVQLARLHDVRGDTAKAFEYAKAARKQAPTDPEVAYATGRLAYRMQDYPWAMTLLRETATNRPSDPDVQFDVALADYSEGAVADAESAAQNALQLNPSFPRAAEAKRFLHLARIGDDPSQAPGAAAEIGPILTAQPDYVPALMVQGESTQAAGNLPAAMQAFEHVLTRYPDFYPAKRPLVLIYAQSAVDNQKVFDLATKAREAFPNDPEVAKACGIIAYREGDFPRSENLLKEAAAAQPQDGQTVFYLGMAQFRLKEKSSKETLQKALALNLPPDLAAQAQKTLSGLK